MVPIPTPKSVEAIPIGVDVGDPDEYVILSPVTKK